jgi:hypothetical protein
MDQFCPHCRSKLHNMPEPHQYACMACQRLWRIYNVIGEAWERSLELPAGTQIVIERDPSGAWLAALYDGKADATSARDLHSAADALTELLRKWAQDHTPPHLFRKDGD